MTRITFQRTGGFMGRKVNAELELENLPEDQAIILEKLLAESDFFSLPDNLITHQVPDGFTYTITASKEEIYKTVNVNDATTSDSLRPLINVLIEYARTRKIEVLHNPHQ
jgi:Emfourin